LGAFGFTDFCSITRAINFVSGSNDIGSYFTYSGGGSGDLFIVRSFDGKQYYKLELTNIDLGAIQFRWAQVRFPACETCVPGQEGMKICFPESRTVVQAGTSPK
jgi:hypothetical protein